MASPAALPMSGRRAILPTWPTLEELERRVEQLEEQLRRELPNKVDAVAYGLSLVHEDTRAIRREHGALLRELSEGQARHGEMLEEILRRLPPGNGEAG